MAITDKEEKRIIRLSEKGLSQRKIKTKVKRALGTVNGVIQEHESTKIANEIVDNRQKAMEKESMLLSEVAESRRDDVISKVDEILKTTPILSSLVSKTLQAQIPNIVKLNERVSKILDKEDLTPRELVDLASAFNSTTKLTDTSIKALTQKEEKLQVNIQNNNTEHRVKVEFAELPK